MLKLAGFVINGNAASFEGCGVKTPTMFIKCVHRTIVQDHPLGQIHWYKTARDHDRFNLAGEWVPQSYVIAVISAGQAAYENSDGLQATVSPGDLLTYFPGVEQRLESEEGMGFGMIAFGGPIFSLWESSGILDRKSPVKHLKDARSWTNRLMSIPVSDDAQMPERDLLETTRLQQFLAEARLQSINSQLSVADIEWMERVRTLLRKEMRHGIDLAVVARQAGMQYEAFRKRFKKLFHLSPRQYHNRLLADSICTHMAETHSGNQEITTTFGFCDEYYFSKFFKTTTGVSPSECRKSFTVGG